VVLDPVLPWGLSWPGFGIGYGVGLVLVSVLLWSVRRRRGWAALPAPLPELRLEQLAYLHGGASRTAEVVLAKLLADKTLLAGKPPGTTSQEAARSAPTVVVRRPAPRPTADVYGVAVRAAAVRTRHEELLELLTTSPELTSVLDGLRADGLIGSGNRFWAVLRRWGPMAPMIALLLVAVTWVGNAGSDHAAWASLPASEKATVVALTALGLVVGMVILVSWWLRTLAEYAHLTPAGLAVVRALRRGRSRRTDDLVAPVAARYEEHLRGPVGVVVLRGLAHHPDPRIQSALHRPAPPPSRDGHAGC
jgi:uncharacterized protein (TIGR04222 family)